MYKEKEIEIDVKSLFIYIKTKWASLLLVVLVSMALAFSVTRFLITPVYESQSMIYITTGTSESSVVQNMLSSIQAGTALTADYKTLATSKPVLEQVIKELDLDLTYSELEDLISTENPDNTRILTLKVKNTDPRLAMNIVNKLTEIERDKIADVMNTTEPNIMQWGDMPTTPVSTSPTTAAMYVGLVSLLLALGYFTVRYIQNDRIVSADDIENTLKLRNLAQIPMFASEDKKKTRRFAL